MGLLLAVLVVGLADELHQSTVRGRDLSVCDLATDLVGASAVLWIVGYLDDPGATETGLWLRWVAGLVACVAAAAVATWLPGFFGDPAWM